MKNPLIYKKLIEKLKGLSKSKKYIYFIPFTKPLVFSPVGL